MNDRIRGWLLASTGCAALIAGCGGSAQDSGPGGAFSGSSSFGGKSADAPGGHGNLGPATSGAGNGGAVLPSGGAGSGGRCVGALNQVAAIWDDCPRTLCAGLVWAESCSALRNRPATSIETCEHLRVITLDFGTHGKACYYGAIGDGEPQLVGATAWDDVPDYCDQTSFQIEAGKTTQCGAPGSDFQMVCDGSSDAADSAGGAGGEAGVGRDTPPKAGPPACFNAFSGSCEPCCPNTAPECTGKPNGYPGYDCTPASNSFCSCACASEAWSCGC